MNKESNLKWDLLVSILDYNPETGEFIRKVSRGNRKAGDAVGYKTNHGYVRVKVNRQYFMAHRLAWFYVHNAWPEADLDHINGKRDDNRIVNLRVATRSQNIQNLRGARKDSKSGILGVDLLENGKWRAQIQIDGVKSVLGYYNTPEEASNVYLTKKREIHEYSML